MKKVLIFILICTVLVASLSLSVAGASQTESYKALYTVDATTGYVIDGKDVDKKLPIASMVKIMTALIGFENVQQGVISLDDDVVISDNSASMGGSQMFLESGDTYKMDDLFKGIIVVSANDACVQLAEVLTGSEGAFVEIMNEKAKKLGMTNTKFANCTGLPADNQYSTARDVSIMLRELVKCPLYDKYSKIWIEDFNHPDGRVTQFVNTNKLVRFYKDCTGGKTGYTSEAGFCLGACAKRGNTRIISVIIGADSSKTRFSTVTKQFNDAFATYETKNVLKKDTIAEKVKVLGGKADGISVMPEKPYFVFGKKGEESNVEMSIDLPDSVKAPVKKGEVLGSVTVCDKGKNVKINLVANDTVDALTYWDVTEKIMQSW